MISNGSRPQGRVTRCVPIGKPRPAFGGHRKSAAADRLWQNPIIHALLMGCLVATLRAAPLRPNVDYVEGEVIVTFKESLNLEAAKTSLDTHQLEWAKHFATLSRHRQKHSGLVRGQNRTTAELITELQNDPSVETAEPNYVRRPSEAVPDDPLFPQLWAFRNTGQTING